MNIAKGVINMVRVIMGKKGSGKTKQVIDMINAAVQSEHGNVVCIEKGNKLTFDIHYQIRLVEASQYDIATYPALKGFVSGLYAGNYDITHIFIDSLTKIVKVDSDRDTEDFLDGAVLSNSVRNLEEIRTKVLHLFPGFQNGQRHPRNHTYVHSCR